MSACLSYKPVSAFNQEDVACAITAEGMIEQAGRQRPVEVGGGIGGIALRPNQVQFRTWLVFPAYDQVGTKLHEVEIGLVETVVCHAIPVFVYGIAAIAKADLCRAEYMEAVVVAFGQRIGHIAKVVVQRAGDERLSIILQGKVGCNIVAQPAGNTQGVLLYPSYDRAGGIVVRNGGYELVLPAPVIGVAAGEIDL